MLLCKAREGYCPKLPKILQNLSAVVLKKTDQTGALGNESQLREKFPHTFGQPIAEGIAGRHLAFRLLRVGVVLSGGQAPGGHNVITGLFDALKKMDHDAELYGFLGGPAGIIEGKSVLLEESVLQSYRNQGGFDLIGSGRTKIETPEQLHRSCETLKQMQLDGLVVVGGDDSNTNAAVLAEYLLENGSQTKVIGVPKTIDGDLRNEHIEISFGFDTATKTYAESLGNIARDCLSAKKYTHFVKLMGRSASHIALECALKVHPNLTLISEEIAEKGQTLQQIIHHIADTVEQRSEEQKNYGLILIPEGLIEAISEMKELIFELNSLVSTSQDDPIAQLCPLSKQAFDSLPESIQKQLLLDRDPHGNVQVSHINTEALLADAVQSELKARGFKGTFQPSLHFFGYEGRAALPSNFDANYTYALGTLAALLIDHGLTGYMCAIQNLKEPVENWKIKGVPITSMMSLEVRKGVEKPVIRKALVDLNKAAFQSFAQHREKWRLNDCYQYPGPIQFFGDPSLTDTVPII